ncbi:hypothetical protein F2P81_013466 [Scophthalmus maximus]|uniref:Uncharacterized protein n=1 Tax=Scophthalmus maximus TaxID=52904 RepID=A0A6A4SNA2_SCOMX|nr:hypothetical protein F2P81_013466 [Scophthalmus maximus]
MRNGLRNIVQNEHSPPATSPRPFVEWEVKFGLEVGHRTTTAAAATGCRPSLSVRSVTTEPFFLKTLSWNIPSRAFPLASAERAFAYNAVGQCTTRASLSLRKKDVKQE